MSDEVRRPPAVSGHTIVFLSILAAGGATLWMTRARPDVLPDVASEQVAGTTPLNQDDVETRQNDRVSMSEYEKLLTLARRDLRAFRERARALVASGPPPARLDALRALHEIDGAAAVPILIDTIGDPTKDPGARDFAFQHLLPRARSDENARLGLLAYLRLRPERAEHRASAFEQVLRWGNVELVTKCMPLLEAESEPDVVVTAIGGMRKSQDAATRNRVQALHWRHPNAKVRQRLRALGVGR